MTLKQCIAKYFNSSWVPAGVSIGLLAVAALSMLLPGQFRDNVVLFLLVASQISLLGILCASVWNLIKRRWLKALVTFLSVLCCTVAMTATTFLVLFPAIAGPSEDQFAENLTIPENMDLAKPKDHTAPISDDKPDPFAHALFAALAAPGDEDPTITAKVPSLAVLAQNHPDTLKRYLCASPSWRVFETRGNVYATRRWMKKYSLHGYYTKLDVMNFPAADIPNFQLRLTIGLSGKPWWRGNSDTTRINAGETTIVSLSEGNQLFESHCVIKVGDVVVEVFEQSGTEERRLTKAALAYIEQELAPMVGNPVWETIKTTLPPDSIRQEGASLELSESFQPGIYDSEIWVNPAESGKIYLKAFEVTQGTALSQKRLKEKSNEWIGWSANPDELFFSNSHFTIYEGDWGNPYAARFEIWFSPASGGTDRKLLEKSFIIEGWQR